MFVLDFKHAGLALAIGLGACINAVLLYYHLRKADVYKPQAGWFLFMVKLVMAVTTMAAALHFAAGTDALWLSYKVMTKLLYLLGLLVLGSGVYFAALWLMGIRVQDFMRRTAI